MHSKSDSDSGACLLMIGVMLYGIVQLYAGVWGIQHAFGPIWALIALALAFLARFSIPLTVGSFITAHQIWGWHWFFAALFAAPLLLVMFAGMYDKLRNFFRRDRGF